MTDRQSLYNGLSHAAWGYFFLCVGILPPFVGWLLFLCTIDELKEERRNLILLRPLAILWALWTGAGWLASWFGGDIDALFPPLDLIMSVAAIYFHFQFLTDIAALAQTYCPHPEEERLSRQILRCRTGQILLVTLLALVAYLPGWLPDTAAAGSIAALAFVYCILSLWLMISLFTLRKVFQDAAPPPLPPASTGGAGEIGSCTGGENMLS